MSPTILGSPPPKQQQLIIINNSSDNNNHGYLKYLQPEVDIWHFKNGDLHDMIVETVDMLATS